MRVQGTENNATILEELGRRVRDARIRSGLTQQDLAVRAGVPLAVVAKTENGKAVRMDAFLELMRALGVLGNVQLLLPEVELSPMEMLKGRQPRRRMRHPVLDRKTQSTWKWGDEE